MTAPVFQAVGTAADGTGPITVNWPVHLPGDIALLIVESANEAISLTTPAGFAEVPNSPQGTGTAGGTSATRLAVYWCRATSSAMASPVVADSGDHTLGVIVTFRGCVAMGDPWNVTAGDVRATASTSVSIPGATTAVAECLVVAIQANSRENGNAATSGWSNADLASVAEIAGAYTLLGNGGAFSLAAGTKVAAGNYGVTTATLANAAVQGRMSIALMPEIVASNNNLFFGSNF